MGSLDRIIAELESIESDLLRAAAAIERRGGSQVEIQESRHCARGYREAERIVRQHRSAIVDEELNALLGPSTTATTP